MKGVRILFEDSAVLLEDAGVLVAADLHLGYEVELAEKGVSLVWRDALLADRLVELGKRLGARRLVLLGDVKHRFRGVYPYDAPKLRRFFGRLLEYFGRVTVTAGNHDGGLRFLRLPGVSVTGPRGMVLRYRKKLITLLHGHAWPGPESALSSLILTGHGHYTIELRDSSGLRFSEPVWIIGELDRREYARRFRSLPARAPRERLEFVVLPSFDRLLGGVPVGRAIRARGGPLMRCVVGEETYVHLLDGTKIASLSRIGELEALEIRPPER